MKSISNDEIKSKLFAYEPKEVTSISQHHMNYKQEGELTDSNKLIVCYIVELVM